MFAPSATAAKLISPPAVTLLVPTPLKLIKATALFAVIFPAVAVKSTLAPRSMSVATVAMVNPFAANTSASKSTVSAVAIAMDVPVVVTAAPKFIMSSLFCPSTVN